MYDQEQYSALVQRLEGRFLAHPERHPALSWAEAASRLEDHPEALEALALMEQTGGEPDVIGRDAATGEILFCDCSAETPAGRRSLCYDQAARLSRKKGAPADSAIEQAGRMGLALLTEEQYLALQELGEFDRKTSSWICAPEEIRRKGGALFCERRYGRVFTFHNGADSYYSVRGWRGLKRV